MRILLLNIFLCFVVVTGALATDAYAQTGEVEGKVYDQTEEKPLPGAHVQVDEKGTVTDAYGRFSIDQVAEGEHQLSVSLMGFASEERTISVASGESVTVDIALKERSLVIDELVVQRTSLTGGRTRLDEIPGSAHYITQHELELAGNTDIHRILQSVPGVQIVEEDGYGLRPNIGLRGTGSNRTAKITVMEDGVLAAPAPYTAPAAYHFPTAARMHGVEVRKGSSQIKYGPYTTGGAINLISTPIPSELSGRVDIRAGEHSQRDLYAQIGDSYTYGGFLLEGLQQGSDGFKKLPSNDGTGFDKRDYLAKFQLNTRSDAEVYQSLQLKLAQMEETSNETYLGLSAVDFAQSPFARYPASMNDVMNTEHRQVQLRHFIQPSEQFDLTTTAYRNNFARNWYKLDAVRADVDSDATGISSILDDPDTYTEEFALLRGGGSDHGNALEVKANNREYVSQGVQAIAGLRLAEGQDTELGLRYHYDDIDRFQWVDHYRIQDGSMQLTEEGTPGTESNRFSTARAWATFAQHRAEFGRFAVTPGLRYEHITLNRTEWDTDSPGGIERTDDPVASRENVAQLLLPGIGVDYDVTDQARIFAGMHRGFSPPSATEGARPEESISYEVGTTFDGIGRSLRVVGYFNDYSNLLGQDMAAVGGDPSGEQFNGGSVHVWGAEVTGVQDIAQLIDLPFSMPIELNYTLTQGSFQSDFESDFGPWGEVSRGDELPYQAAHQLAGSARLVGVGNLSAELRGRYTSTMRTEAGTGAPAANERIDGHFVLDASAEYRLLDGVRLFTSIRNLTDETYATARRPAGLRPGLPRTLQLGVKVQF